MPYKDPSRRQLVVRSSMRARRHGKDWRGIAWKYGITCANTGKAEFPDCLEELKLEFHEPNNGTYEHPGVGERILLCKTCHRQVHGERFDEKRGYDGMVREDCELEMEICGGYWAWVKRYNVGSSLREGERPEPPLGIEE